MIIFERMYSLLGRRTVGYSEKPACRPIVCTSGQ